MDRTSALEMVAFSVVWTMMPVVTLMAKCISFETMLRCFLWELYIIIYILGVFIKKPYCETIGI